jgi:hypothetical protein
MFLDDHLPSGTHFFGAKTIVYDLSQLIPLPKPGLHSTMKYLQWRSIHDPSIAPDHFSTLVMGSKDVESSRI